MRTPEQKEILFLKRQVKQLKRELKESDHIFIDGFNGGNCVYITKLDDNRIELKIGDCCVYTIHSILTAEAFSGFLTKIWLDANKPFLEFVYDNLRWDKKHNDMAIDKCVDLNKRK